jgi:hypothetical protein
MPKSVSNKAGRRPFGTSCQVSFDDLCRMAKVRTMEDFDSDLMDNGSAYPYVYKQALEDGKSEADAEQAALTAATEEETEATNKYHDAVMGVVDRLFSEHKLLLMPVYTRRHKRLIAQRKASERAYEFRVVPQGTWTEALLEIRQTLNGAGPFYFGSNAELTESGPWTVRQAVLSHLHWIFEWFSVYEGGSCSSRIDRALR